MPTGLSRRRTYIEKDNNGLFRIRKGRDVVGMWADPFKIATLEVDGTKYFAFLGPLESTFAPLEKETVYHYNKVNTQVLDVDEDE